MLRRCGVATCEAACHSAPYDSRMRESRTISVSVTPAPMVSSPFDGLRVSGVADCS